jgi:hypothetical protein
MGDELLGPAALQLFCTFGKTYPKVAMHTTSFTTKTDFWRRLMSANLRPLEYSRGVLKGVGVGVGTASSLSLDWRLRGGSLALSGGFVCALADPRQNTAPGTLYV